MKILITGAAGFIGSNFVHYMHKKHNDLFIAIYDKLTYAGNMSNLVGLPEEPHFYEKDICDYDSFLLALLQFKPDYVVHFAAESHVDRSLESPQEFLDTNILGTETILRAVKNYNSHTGEKIFGNSEEVFPPIKKLVHISTDEVYGSLKEGEADEEHAFRTNSPYSASKAAGDLMCRAYFKSYGVPISIVRGSNCYGPRQFPEKLIPLTLTNLMGNKKIGIYGTGLNVREWIYTEDFASGVEAVMLNGRLGEAYNLGGGMSNRVTNLDIISELLRLLGKNEDSIEFVKDRAGHDMRYALNSNKLKKELGWSPHYSLAAGLEKTVAWYKDNQWWWKPLI
jgi:dTDP-glucose 4,6-dehydratase